MTVEININMDRKCAECGKPGAVQNGLCLKCCSKALGPKRMKSERGRAVQDYIRAKYGRKGKADAGRR